MTVVLKRKRVAIYVRISKDRAGAGVGVAEQVRLCRELAARMGFEVVAVYEDNDISAFKQGAKSKPRPDYDRLLGDLRARRVDAVLAWHTDRLHRDLPELEGYIEACGVDRDGIPTYTVQGGDLDLSTSSGRMVARILAAVARQEVEHAIERIRASKERNRVNGLRTAGNAPLGYRTDERDASGKQIPGVSRGLVIVPEEAAWIRKAYADLLAGASLYAIAKEWSAAGIKTHRGGGSNWLRSSVRRVLLRAANAGLIESPVNPPGEGEIIGKAAWEPIVDEDTWRAARALLLDPGRHNGRGRKPAHLLTGVLICGICGCRSFGVRSCKSGAAGRYWRYSCNSLLVAPNDPRSGSHLGIRQQQLDEYVRVITVQRLARADTIAAFRKRDIDVTPLIARTKALQAELDEWAAADITPRAYKIREAKLLPQIEAADQALADAYSVTQRHLAEFEGASTPEAVDRIWQGLPMDRKREIIKMLMRVRLHPGKRGRPGPDATADLADRVEPLDPDTPAGAVPGSYRPVMTPAEQKARRERAEAELLASQDTHNAIARRVEVSPTSAGKYCERLIKNGDLPGCPHVHRADGWVQPRPL